MAGSLVARAMGVLDFLSGMPQGAPLQTIADRLGCPKSGAFRLLAELVALGYVVQDPRNQAYLPTTRLMTLGFRQLGECGFVEVAQPALNRLAQACGELVRLAVVDHERLVFVVKAQGARSGLRFDPDMGCDAALYCSASGQAWLASMDEDAALRLLGRQGLVDLESRGRAAPRSLREALGRTAEARARGWAQTEDSWAPGMSSMAAVVRGGPERAVWAVLSIAGPALRLDAAARKQLAPALLAAAAELGAASPMQSYLRSLNADLTVPARV